MSSKVCLLVRPESLAEYGRQEDNDKSAGCQLVLYCLLIILASLDYPFKILQTYATRARALEHPALVSWKGLESFTFSMRN